MAFETFSYRLVMKLESYCLAREISMSFEQPLMIPAYRATIRLPEAVDDDRLSDEIGKWNVQPKSLPSLLEYYIQTIKLYTILRQVLDRQERTGGRSQEEPSDNRAMLSLDSEIMTWRGSLPTYLKYDPPSNQSIGTDDAASDCVLNSQETLDFPALSKRLYCRY